ncbi:MAG: recombination protein O N-terminal domain-containing protein [Spirochaetaceae bacterium]|jgi:DNA repair protein RecO (recombination protein O)|nr:recombination protein O N-terminal domain-containing protein [Spirochaetaceae bacterium]
MNRHQTCPALVLALRPFGESNREAFFLTPSDGVIRAAVYGGPKSKLRAYVAPFQTGTLYLYHDTVRETNKVSDFDVSAWRPGIRELLERLETAAFIADALLAGAGGGSECESAFILANAGFDALQTASALLCEKIRVHFLWNWLEILGLRPSPDEGFPAENFTAKKTARPLLNTETFRFLTAIGQMPPHELEHIAPGTTSFSQIAAFLNGMWREVLGKR